MDEATIPQPRDLSKHAKDCIDLTLKINELESRLKVLKKSRQTLTHKKMPELMDELGVDEITVDGRKFKKDLYATGSWPKDEFAQTQALAHLEELDAIDLLDTQLILSFERDEYNLARHYHEEFKDIAKKVELKVGVHHSRLKSFVRNRVIDGDPIEPEALNIYLASYVKAPKK